jgi:hypothetical protein
MRRRRLRRSVSQVARLTVAAAEASGCTFFLELTLEHPFYIDAEFLTALEQLVEVNRPDIVRLIAGGA